MKPANQHPCAICGQRASNWHEKLPRGRGGTRDAFNAVALCGSGSHGCHGHVTAHPAWATANGMTVPGYMLAGRYVGSDPEYRAHYGDGRRP